MLWDSGNRMHNLSAWIESHKGESIGIAIGLIGLVVVLFLARRGGSGNGAPGQTPAFIFPGAAGGGGGGSSDGGGPGATGGTGATGGGTSDRTPAPQVTPVAPAPRVPAPQSGGSTDTTNSRTPAPQTQTSDILSPFSGSSGSSSRVGAPQSN